MRGNETVHVKRPAPVDWQGDPTGPPQEFDIPFCQLWPRSSTEDAVAGRVIIEGWNVYIPPRSVNTVYATDTLTIRGLDYNVVGVPGKYDLKGRDKGIIVVVSRTGQ
jgi:hypothetical protein